MRRVVILLFDDVEVLDFAGPFEVFAVTGQINTPCPFEVTTVSERGGMITARNGLRVETLPFADAKPDVLVIPGGQGTRPLLNHAPVIDWIRRTSQSAELTLSVCTGALLLGRAGLLDGLSATTHHLAMEELRKAAPAATVRPGERIVDNGRIVTSAGVAAGIDASLHCVSRLLGSETALRTAEYIEYPWKS